MIRLLRRVAIPALSLLLVASLIPGAGGRSTASAAPAVGTQQAADMTSVITKLLNARWNALVQEDDSLLNPAYSSTASKLLNTEKVRMVKHYMIAVRQAGQKYTGFTNTVTIKSLNQKANVIEASVKETVSLTWGPMQKPDLNVSGIALEHELTLVQEAGRWVISSDNFVDEYQYLNAVERPDALLPGLRTELQKAKSKVPRQLNTVPNKEDSEPAVSIMATAYDKWAARDYAWTYALAQNPDYKYFGGTGNNGDCTNFASQALWRGGGLYDYAGSWQWWYNFNGTINDTSDDTYSHLTWTTVGSFYWLLLENARLAEAGPKGTAMDIGTGWSQAAYDFLYTGDFIQYDFDNDGVYTHTAIVTNWDNSVNPPEPKISQHSSFGKDITWRKTGAKVRLIHVTAQN
jgi:hypothetical protein